MEGSVDKGVDASEGVDALMVGNLGKGDLRDVSEVGEGRGGIVEARRGAVDTEPMRDGVEVLRERDDEINEEEEGVDVVDVVDVGKEGSLGNADVDSDDEEEEEERRDAGATGKTP